MSKHTFQGILAAVTAIANPTRAIQAARFFKVGKGEYGEGDMFLGISNPDCRKIAKEHKDMNPMNFGALLTHQAHQIRMIGLAILDFYSRKHPNEAHRIYLDHIEGVNNWDLVDLSAPKILGNHLLHSSIDPLPALSQLASSHSLWKRRISMLAMFPYIRKRIFSPALALSQQFLGDKEDLMHKAVGWMLREVGKRDESTLKAFIKQHYSKMPRTTLRYAIEKFEEGERKRYLKGSF